MDHEGMMMAYQTTPSEEKLRSAISDDWRRLLINSLVLAVAIPTLLSRFGGDPVIAGWSLSLFLVFYLFACTCFFSTVGIIPLSKGSLRVKARECKVFASLSSVGILAFFAGSHVSNVFGMVIIYLNSVLAAAFFGVALAKFREGNGTERVVLAAVTNAPFHETCPKRCLYYFLGIMALLHASCLWWMMMVSAHYGDALLVATALLAGLQYIMFIYMLAVLGWLNGAFFADDDYRVTAALWFLMAAVLFLCSYIFVGQLAAVTVLWLCVLVSTAFNGYCVRLHASYECIMESIRYHRKDQNDKIV